MDDLVEQYSEVLRADIGYVHLLKSRVKGCDDVVSNDKLDFACPLFKGLFVVAGDHTGDSARKLLDEEIPERDIAVAFGRRFIADTGLVFRIKHGLELNPYDRSSFYSLKEPKGYIDYPFSLEYHESVNENKRRHLER